MLPLIRLLVQRDRCPWTQWRFSTTRKIVGGIEWSRYETKLFISFSAFNSITINLINAPLFNQESSTTSHCHHNPRTWCQECPNPMERTHHWTWCKFNLLTSRGKRPPDYLELTGLRLIELSLYHSTFRIRPSDEHKPKLSGVLPWFHPDNGSTFGPKLTPNHWSN